jgi:hypothetical protein
MPVRRAATVVALVLATTLAGCGGSDKETGKQPGATLTARAVPSGDEVVAMPGALVDQDFFATNDAGDLLSGVVVDRPGSSSEWCGTTDPAALVWSGHHGGRRTFTGDVTARVIGAAQGGFVVGAVRADCQRSATGPHGDPDAYLVTGAGRAVEIGWPDGSEGAQARAVCAPDPRDPRCAFSAVDGSVRFRAGATLHGAAEQVGDLLVAATDRPVGLWWSADEGATWQQRRSALAFPRGRTYATGEAPVISNGTEVEYSTDGGRTWPVRRLPSAVDQVGITRSGVLLAVLRPGRQGDWTGYQVVRATDDSWTHLVPMPARAWLGPLWLTIHGNAVYVFNHPDVWWVSTDAGAHWRVVAPLADR